jgi:predicted RNA-binding Zn-ribbon protein involved in translation (DUF1610 family)
MITGNSSEGDPAETRNHARHGTAGRGEAHEVTAGEPTGPHQVTSELTELLVCATHLEEEILRPLARRAGLLWACPTCGFDTPAAELCCDGCGRVKP